MHVLGITAYVVPWLSQVHDSSMRVPLAGAVLVLAVGTAAWATRSRRPTIISVLGALLVAGVIGLAPMITPASGYIDPVHLLNPRTAVGFGVAVALGVLLARPAVRGRREDERPARGTADQSAARAAAWLVFVATPPLAFAAYLFWAGPRSPEGIFGLAVAATIVVFGLVVWLTRAARSRALAHQPLPRSPVSPSAPASAWPAMHDRVRHREAFR